MSEKKDEALKLALEALVAAFQGKDKTGQVTDAITAIREALAEQPAQQQEPVAWILKPTMELLWPDEIEVKDPSKHRGYKPLYTSPQPSKPWVGLTQEDMYEIGEFKNTHGYVPTGFKRLAAAIEAKLREKNA